MHHGDLPPDFLPEEILDQIGATRRFPEGKLTPQDEGEIYLAHEDQVDNIIALKFAVRDAPPKRATR